MSRSISAIKIKETVEELCIKANLFLRKDVLGALKKAYAKETNKKAKVILAAIIRNAQLAGEKKIAICQDTGLPAVFVRLGEEVSIKGSLITAINRGVESGYRKAFLRNSVVRDPLLRLGPCYSPAVIHTEIVRGRSLGLTVLPKGFGCENKTQLKMFNPTASIEEVKYFIVSAVKDAGPDACPPYVVGVGIGGSADYACLLAKKALLRDISKPNAKKHLAVLERELLALINRLNIGPMGLGGKATALGVSIEAYPTHIAGLPVAVNINCHALRSASKNI